MTLSVVYEPRGRAREYSPLALNLYRGCSTGCQYCYGPDVLHMQIEEFHKPVPRAGIIAKIVADAKALQAAGNQKPILLCFTSSGKEAPCASGGRNCPQHAPYTFAPRGISYRLMSD